MSVQLRVGIRVACETILPITDPNALVGNKHFTKEGYIQSVLKDFKSFEATLHATCCPKRSLENGAYLVKQEYLEEISRRC